MAAGRAFAGCLGLLAALGTRQTQAGELVPGVLEREVLVPSKRFPISVDVGKAKFLGFTCEGGPADVVISLSTYAQRADPLLFLSLNPSQAPTFQQHDASSFGQWREDAAGDHYVIAKAVNPKGGILGLVNMRQFAGEELNGILTIHCTFIIAFDTLFWDHLRSQNVCPVGSHIKDGKPVQAANFCSGHGQCGKHGVCQCDANYAGEACEHSKIDVVVVADGHYNFEVDTGRYQYFRVRIPPRFSGGYLSVKLMSGQPLVVLVRGDDLPTKYNYELSNFDDWVNHRSISEVKYRVPSAEELRAQELANPGYASAASGQPPVGLPGVTGIAPPAPPTSLGGRRLLEASSEPGRQPQSWGDLFRLAGNRASDDDGGGLAWEEFAEEAAPPRELQVGASPAECASLAPALTSPACASQPFMDCRSSCKRCMVCVKGGEGGVDDHGCREACDACTSPGCVSTLAQCAADASCKDMDAERCESCCGNCIACFDSNDKQCSNCEGCLDCLPLAAKCSMSQPQAAEYNRFAFVGVYNHRRYYKTDEKVVYAAADISLTSDPDFRPLASDWISNLYDPFHDMRILETSMRQIYPDGQQFIFQVDLKTVDTTSVQVQLYASRLTLLRISGLPGQVSKVRLQFSQGPNVTHILSSSKAAPKTFFDFDNQHEHNGGRVYVPLQGEPTLWCALFGAKDGYLQVTIKVMEADQQAPAIGFGLVLVFTLMCALLVLGVIYGGAQKLGEFLGMDPNIPIMERLGCLVRNVNPHESTVALTRTGSLTGYIGSDVIDRSVEDQYLHRGGSGDDGI